MKGFDQKYYCQECQDKREHGKCKSEIQVYAHCFEVRHASLLGNYATHGAGHHYSQKRECSDKI